MGKYNVPKITYSRNAIKDIKKLDRVAKKRIGKKILVYSKSPLRYAKKLSSSRLGGYRWRTGRYRIIFDLKGKTIQILRVRDRKDVYKK